MAAPTKKFDSYCPLRAPSAAVGGEGEGGSKGTTAAELSGNSLPRPQPTNAKNAAPANSLSLSLALIFIIHLSHLI